MKTLFSLILLSAVLALSGCAETSQVLTLPGVAEKAVDKIPADVGRFSAHVAVRAAEEQTKQKVVDLEKARIDLEKAQAQNTTITVSTDAQAFALAMVESSRAMREAFRAMSKRDGATEYGLTSTPTPKGVFAESLDSVGDAVGKAANSPAALATSTGIFFSKVAQAGMREAGDKVDISGDQNSASINKQETSIKADNQAVVNNTPSSEKVSATGTCSISATQLADCRTTEAGSATADEYSACLTQDYGYSSEQIAACPQ